MLSRGIKKMRTDKAPRTIAAFCCLAFASALAFMAFTYLTEAVAAEKKSDTKSVTKAGTKAAAKPVQTAVSLEEERLKILNADMLARIDELKKLKAEIEGISKGLDAKKKEQLGKVVKMYESMPAEEAARAISKLDDETAVQILTALKSRSAGQIMAQMDSDRVASLSKKAILRGRLPKEKTSP
jgi:flagellar motility protein MotE (MotC chaperone)